MAPTATRDRNDRLPQAVVLEGSMRLHLWVLQLATLAMVLGGCGRVQGDAGVRKMTVYYFPMEQKHLLQLHRRVFKNEGDIAKFAAVKI